ncbi:hypothetical protein RFI_35575, partial [Reticulomyxa filosa]
MCSIVSEDDLNDSMQKAFFNIAKRASAFEQYLCKYFGINSNELKYLFCGFNQDIIPSAISCLYASKISNNANVDFNAELLKLFFPLMYFFKVMDLNKNRRLQNEEIRFPTFAKVVSDAKSQRNALILVLMNGLERTIFQQRYDECKNMDLYLKVSEFKKEVDDFFQSKNRQMLMLQYQHKNENLMQYFQTNLFLKMLIATTIVIQKFIYLFFEQNMENVHSVLNNLLHMYINIYIIFIMIIYFCALNVMADEQVLNKTLQCGFYHLKFSHLIDAPFALSNLFGMQDPKWTKLQSVMIQRLQWTIQETISTEDVLCELSDSFQQDLNAMHRYHLVKEYQNVVDYVVFIIITEAQFPFSWNFHVRCFGNISGTMESLLSSGNTKHAQQDKI